VRPTGANLGFPGNNVAMRDLDDVDHVALVNNDAFVEPDWLAPLVAELEGDPELGAACPRIVFADRFLVLTITSPTFRPGTGDGRALGVRLSGVEVDGADAWRDAQRVQGFWGLEHGGGDEVQFEWTQAEALVRVPVSSSEAKVRVRLAAEATKVVTVAGAEVEVGPRPRWVDVTLTGTPYDVVNNVGSILVEGGYGADRGYLQRDEGQFDAPEEVFGGLRRALLPLLRGHGHGLAGAGPRVAVPLRARLPAAPHPRRQQR
jgi:hypothetical protein